MMNQIGSRLKKSHCRPLLTIFDTKSNQIFHMNNVFKLIIDVFVKFGFV